MKILRTTCLLLAACGASALADDDGWVSLFNGKNLDGWVQRGGKAKYTVEDNCIVGTTVLNTDNSFLCTEKEYGDFILELDFKVDPRLNSGIQIRSECFPEARTLEIGGKQIKVPANRVHGYQCEIDMDPARKRWWTAGIYDEARRGWLKPAEGEKTPAGVAFTEQGLKTSKQNEWNHIRIEAIGTSITTRLNGELRAELTDGLTPRGLIGLQVHGIGKDAKKEGIQVRFKNIRLNNAKVMANGAILGKRAAAETPNTLTPEEKSAGWRLLWDGKTADGWRSARSEEFPKGGWSMHDGILAVHETGGKESAAGGDIITKEKFSDFELKVDFKITAGANSGIKIFVDPNINKGAGSSIGPEFQILDDAKHPDAKLGRNGNRTIGSLYDMIPAPADKKVMPIGEWNQAYIISKGKHVEFRLNGVKTVEFERGSKEWRDLVAISKFKVWPAFGELAEGHILLQDHGNQVFFRNIKIRTK